MQMMQVSNSNNVNSRRSTLRLTCFLLLMTCGMPMHSFGQQPLLWLVAGQSNAVGQGDSATSQRDDAMPTWEYKFSIDSVVPLVDPVGENSLSFQKANSGSVAPAFATTLSRETGRPVVIVCAARGGASCHRKAELSNYGTWDETGDLLLFDDAMRKVEAAEKKLKTSLAGILWLQGERDANAINDHSLTETEYEQALTGLIKRVRKRLRHDVLFCIVETGNYLNHPQGGFDAVRRVQTRVASRMKNVTVVYTETKDFATRSWMKDEIHYNQAGLNHIGTSAAHYILKQKNP